jgi:hypothetical protein
MNILHTHVRLFQSNVHIFIFYHNKDDIRVLSMAYISRNMQANGNYAGVSGRAASAAAGLLTLWVRNTYTLSLSLS